MQALEWIFDPLPPSQAMQGGNASLHVFKAELETFVREVLQNSRDQRVAEAVRVVFTFERLSGPHKTEFLSAIGWSTLQPHVKGAADANFAQVSRTIADGLKSLEEDDALTILRIDDFGTRGLIGGENDPNANFNALCRNTLVSKDDPERGGSYGLGKAVLWRFSSILTVLFSSRINGPPQKGLRFFGRSELPFHESTGDQYAGPGWYGVPEVLSNGRRAASAWDDQVERLAQYSRLSRGETDGTGTSILVVGFREPEEEEVRPVRQVAHDLATTAAKWFWPTIQRGELLVQVAAKENGRTVFDEDVEIGPDVDPFALAASRDAELRDPPLQSGEVTEVPIPFTVPGRKGGGTQMDATMKLRVRRSPEGGGLENKVAMTRGAGMVVQYRPVRTAGSSDRTFHAVLLAGLANGDTAEDKAVEAFLRAAEPPAHDEWKVTSRVRSEYKPGFHKTLQELAQRIDRTVARLFEEQAPDNTPGPEMLAKMFRIGSPDGPRDRVPPAKFRVRGLHARFAGGVWEFEGTVVRAGSENRPWEVRIALALAGETGQGEALAITELVVDSDLVTVKDLGPERLLEVPSAVSEVYFTGASVRVVDAADILIARRTRLDLDVRPALRGGVRT